MLKRVRSLAFRAALIFVPVYILISLAGLTFFSFVSLSTGGRHYSGPRVALTYITDELLYDGGSLRLPMEGPFGQFAASNPSLWVLAEDNGRIYSFGPVPPAARRLFESYVEVADAANFQVPGVARPLSDAALERHGSAHGQALLATGGIDPETISVADSFRYFLSQGLFWILAVLAFCGLAAMLIALPLLTRALRPLARDAASISPEALSRRLNENGVPKELLPLVGGFNAALDRLAAEMDRRKRIIANLAHELRTPLAIIALQVQALRDEEEKAELNRIVTRLGGMVGQMLDVERLSAGPTSERLDLAVLASQVVADMAPMAIKSGYDLSLTAPREPVWVAGDHSALSRAVANLIGNAIAHGGGRGAIRVRVTPGGELDVVDEGPGVSEDIRSTLFEPFTRGRWDRDGCGLGLHLTREIVRAHGGDAVLLAASIGAAFRISLPLIKNE